MPSLTEWLESFAERLTESVTCEQPFANPADVVVEVEQRMIRATGRNINLIEVNMENA